MVNKMISKTISVTIPEQLEEILQRDADELGLSRSRFICNILLEWQKEKENPTNDCINLNGYWCDKFDISCKAPQLSAETCAGYKKTNKE